jgi:hypothetical protein
LISPDASPQAVARVGSKARTLQFDEPLSPATLDALRAALAESPETELYVYGFHEEEVDNALPFLDGFEFLRALSISLARLTDLDGVSRFGDLRRLTIGPTAAKLSLRPLVGLSKLESLHLPGPAGGPEVLGDLASLRTLAMPANQQMLDAIGGHAGLQRLILHFGAARDLRALASLPALRDLLIWQVSGLDSTRLEPVGQCRILEALALGAARNVASLKPLEGVAGSLRYLEFERLSGLESLEPVGSLSELRALCMFDSRPVDQSLAPLARLKQLADLTIGDVYPEHEVDALIAAQPGLRHQIRERGSKEPRRSTEPSRIRWRGLFAYVDEERRDRDAAQ